MSLRVRTLLLLALTMAVSAGVLFGISRAILGNSFSDLEAEETRTNVDRAVSALSNEVASLNTLASSLGSSNDTSRFMQGQLPDFPTARLTNAFFTQIAVDVLLFYNTPGSYVYGKAVDLREGTEVPVPQDLLGQASTTDALENMFIQLTANDSLRGLLERSAADGSFQALMAQLAENGTLPELIKRLAAAGFLQDFTQRLAASGALQAVLQDLTQKFSLAELAAQASPSQPSPPMTDRERVAKGLVQLPEGPLLLSQWPILGQTPGRPFVGVLVVGRFLRPSRLQALAQSTRLSLTAYPADGAQAPPDVASARLSLSDAAPVAVRPASDAVRGYALLKDVRGQPSLVLRTESPRDIHDQGQSTQRYILVSVVIAAIVVGGVALVLLERFVLARVRRLGTQVVRIGATGNTSARVSLSGRDEISQLGSEINSMLGALQESQTEQARTAAELRDANQRLQGALTELQTTQQQLVHEERLRALGQMAGGVAHDMSNALSPVLGFSELLMDRLNETMPQDEAAEYARIINTAATDATKMVGRLREISRPQDRPEVLKSLDLNTLAQDALALTQPKWKNQALGTGVEIRVETDLQPLPQIAGDPSELREVLTNLIINAVDAMPAGGTITVRTRREDSNVVLTVQDTGTGMSEEVRHRCLEPFFTTKGTHGMGLGLAIVNGIVRRHHGAIDIQSEAGKGTSFVIRLPAHPQENGAGLTMETPHPAKPLRVLVAEDDPFIRSLVQHFLALEGHTVETAGDGQEGLAKFQAGSFDLVVTDRAMPKLSGETMATTIHEIAPAVPIILLTGFSEASAPVGQQHSAITLVVSKPITRAALREALAKATAP